MRLMAHGQTLFSKHFISAYPDPFSPVFFADEREEDAFVENSGREADGRRPGRGPQRSRKLGPGQFDLRRSATQGFCTFQVRVVFESTRPPTDYTVVVSIATCHHCSLLSI